MTPEIYHDGALGDYQTASSTTGRVVDPNRNFRDLAEMTSFLEVSCRTCYYKGSCSDLTVLRHHERVCKTDAGRCIYSFPSKNFRRTEAGAECKNYKPSDFHPA